MDICRHEQQDTMTCCIFYRYFAKRMLADEQTPRHQKNTTAQPRSSRYACPLLFGSGAKGASVVCVFTAALRWRPRLPSSSVLLTFMSVPGAPRLKSLGRGGRRVRSQYGEVTPTPETSSRRPGFAQLLPLFPRSFAHVHLMVCQGRLDPPLQEDSRFSCNWCSSRNDASYFWQLSRKCRSFSQCFGTFYDLKMRRKMSWMGLNACGMPTRATV